jgi:hypothetical protein
MSHLRCSTRWKPTEGEPNKERVRVEKGEIQAPSDAKGF